MTGREREKEAGREDPPSLRSLSPILPVPSLCLESEHKRCREVGGGAPPLCSAPSWTRHTA
jgi:hypothetical protein